MTCDTRHFEDELAELGSAEEFLDYFGIPYDTRVVQVNRLHILQRFHDYLGRYAANMPPEESAQRSIYRLWLERAYLDFVESDALTEKVFRVFQQHDLPGGGHTSFVSLDRVFSS